MEAFVNERDAIERMKRGEIDGLELLVKTYQVQAVRTAMLITRDRPLAEDVVQSAFITAYERIHQFDSSKPFAPWFMRSVVNVAVKMTKKQSRVLSLDDKTDAETAFVDLLPDLSSEPYRALLQSEQRERIKHALDQLSPEQRAVVVMRYFLDMSEREISDSEDVPAGTVKWRIHTAKKRLRGLLKQMAGGTATGWEAKNG